MLAVGGGAAFVLTRDKAAPGPSENQLLAESQARTAEALAAKARAEADAAKAATSAAKRPIAEIAADNITKGIGEFIGGLDLGSFF